MKSKSLKENGIGNKVVFFKSLDIIRYFQVWKTLKSKVISRNLVLELITKMQMPYLNIDMGHQDCKVGEMSTGTCGVCPIGTQQAAVLRRPDTGHSTLRITPERAVWVEVFLRLLIGKEEKKDI